MSRTHKDKPLRIQWPEYYGEYDQHTYVIPGTWHRLYRKGVKPKKKRCKDIWHWVQSTPSWWTRMTMNKPKRRRCRVWEHKALHLTDLSETICPDWGRKPHHYYW